MKALGASVVDTDEISRALTAAGGDAIPALRDAFGSSFFSADGALDRAAMRSLVFSDAAARARLEAILHPAIRSRADREIDGAKGPYAVVVVPLLFETGGYGDRVDRVLVVDCAEALQVERTRARSGLSEAEARAVMAAQWPRWRRLQSADDVVWNGGSVEETSAQCEKLHGAYCYEAGASATIPANPRRGR
jgi:dephospho-CoA kinase